MKKLSLLLGVFLISVAGPIAADSLYVAVSGNVGVGTNTPGEKLHILDGNLKIEQTAVGVPARIEFTTAGSNWQINQNGTTGRLVFANTGFAGAPFKFQPGAVDNLFRIGVKALDTVDINGKLVVNDVQISDYVFSPEYELKTIDEQAEFMSKYKHLPAVQKGDDNLRADVDVMGNQMAILEELEKAHIYITQLNSALKDMRADIEELKANQL